ncbi:SSS family solute:Na+ symporter [Desulfohalotomaculum tongense]|uniref:sodium:solute symporter family transporter n=1 Tax=Desulforadius tongensis TaxID=1216062 RepID=UPI001A9C6FC7|nr:sodium/solute symporter [Desulforadius tongensis]MBM7853771.1 SSS family solute:Na+ symporter [Desulforadius tongensis]
MIKGVLLFLFVGFLLYSGLANMRKARTVNDFLLGGRGVGPWLSAFAYGTTYFSAVIFIGYAGKVGWAFGLSSLWIVVGNTLVGSLLAWMILAKPTRLITTRLNTMTMPQFLGARYQSPGMKIFAALVIFVFMVPYSASVYMGLSYLFEQIFGLPYIYAAVAMATLTGVYLVLGGYRAMALTDFVQGCVMLLGIVLMLWYVFKAPQVGGLVPAVQKMSAIDPQLAQIIGPPGWLPMISLVILTSLGTWGLPQMVQKFYAIKDEHSIKPATIVASTFALVITFGAYCTGALTRLFFKQPPVDALTGKPTVDLLMPQLISTVLPEFVAAVILILVLSASMSTLASLVLVSGSAVAVDLLPTVLPKLSDKRRVMILRLLCAVFIALSLVLALAKPAVILSLMALSWSTVAGAFLAPYLYGLFWRGATQTGAWAGALAGLTISIVFSVIYPSAIPTVGSAAMLISLLVVPAVSMVTKPLPQKHLAFVFGEQTRPGCAEYENPGSPLREQAFLQEPPSR